MLLSSSRAKPHSMRVLDQNVIGAVRAPLERQSPLIIDPHVPSPCVGTRGLRQPAAAARSLSSEANGRPWRRLVPRLRCAPSRSTDKSSVSDGDQGLEGYVGRAHLALAQSRGSYSPS